MQGWVRVMEERELEGGRKGGTEDGGVEGGGVKGGGWRVEGWHASGPCRGLCSRAGPLPHPSVLSVLSEPQGSVILGQGQAWPWGWLSPCWAPLRGRRSSLDPSPGLAEPPPIPTRPQPSVGLPAPWTWGRWPDRC